MKLKLDGSLSMTIFAVHRFLMDGSECVIAGVASALPEGTMGMNRAGEGFSLCRRRGGFA